MSIFSKTKATMAAHKVLTAIIGVIVLVIAYRVYLSVSAADAAPSYAVSPAKIGTLTQTVTGSGQISASNQTDIQSQVSGTIETIPVSVGEHVTTGEIIATLDSTNAGISLQNAKISLAKLVEPAKATDISNAQSSLTKSYGDAFNAAATAYTDIPNIVSGMKDLYYSQTGFLSDATSANLPQVYRTMRDQAGEEYDAAVREYQNDLSEFSSTTASSPGSAITSMVNQTYAMMKDLNKAVLDTQNTITTIVAAIPDYDPKGAASATTNVNSWVTTLNSDSASLLSNQNSITTSQNSLTSLMSGSDQYDIRAAELAVEQAQNTYDNYFIRAPYDGVIGRIPVNVFGQASNGTVIATIIGQDKVATVSLNEVDAAKVKTGQHVNITFDAIDGLNATGTVEQVDQVGTVSSGVVSYGVKILVNTADQRIKPGMSVNVTIITNQEDGVLLVPTSAIKTQGSLKYVQVIDTATVMNAVNTARTALGQSPINLAGTSTRRFAGQFATSSPDASSTNMGSTTREFGGVGGSGGSGGGGTGAGGPGRNGTLTITVSTSAALTQIPVTTGDSDDTNTVILSGLSRGQFVVTRTISAGSNTTASAPSILSSFGARRPAGGGGGGNVRIGG